MGRGEVGPSPGRRRETQRPVVVAFALGCVVALGWVALGSGGQGAQQQHGHQGADDPLPPPLQLTLAPRRRRGPPVIAEKDPQGEEHEEAERLIATPRPDTPQQQQQQPTEAAKDDETVVEDQGAGGSCSKKLLPAWDPLEFMQGKINAEGGTTGGSDTEAAVARGFCHLYGEQAIPRMERPNLIYGSMFNFEAPMLEVLLNEIYPLVSAIILIESSITHSAKQKEPVWPTVLNGTSPGGAEVQRGISKFLDKIQYHWWVPKKKLKSGWDVERGQREEFVTQLYNNPPKDLRAKDIVIGNMDLDEIPSRTLLTRLKYCAVGTLKLRIFHFRYHLGCLQTNVVDDLFHTVFRWPGHSETGKIKDLKKGIYKAREFRRRNEIPEAELPDKLPQKLRTDADTMWHLSTFDGLENVIRKYKHSPHGFVGEISPHDVEAQLNGCRYQGKQMFKVPFMKRQSKSLPWFIRNNMCYFTRRGWFGGTNRQI